MLLLFVLALVACAVLVLVVRKEGFHIRQLYWGPHIIQIKRGSGAKVDPKPWDQTLMFGRSMDSAYVTFRVAVGEKFKWDCRGKIGGFLVGSGGSTGGKHTADGSSYRIMWNKVGGVYMYVYVPYGSQPYQVHPVLKKYPDDKEYGTPIFEWDFPGALLPKQTYHLIEMGLKLNSFTGTTPNADGVLFLRVKGKQSRVLRNVVMRLSPHIKLDRFKFAMFHGGPCKASDDMAAAVKDVHLYSWI